MKRVGAFLKGEIDAAPVARGGGGRDVKLAAFVVQLVALSTDVGAGAIASTSRQCADAARARQIAMYLVHTACEWRLARVASAFGRDRSTISYACRRVEDQREDASFDGWLLRLEGCIRAVVFGGVAA
jgi:hypothetical protein